VGRSQADQQTGFFLHIVQYFSTAQFAAKLPVVN
jgi:hypothetical protein